MNEALQNALASLLAQSTSFLQDGVNYMQAQLPDVVQQLLTWHLIRYSMYVIVAVLLVVAAGVIIRCGIRWVSKIERAWTEYAIARDAAEKKADVLQERVRSATSPGDRLAAYDEHSRAWDAYLDVRANRPRHPDDAKGVVVAVSSIAAFIAAAGFFVFVNLKWLQILVAPKVYLIEYAASLVK